MSGIDQRPNVVIVMTDQQAADAMSCAGNPDLRTPAIDSLAAAGTRFRAAYCTSPLCAPSRASMMTGRMPSELGVDDNVKEPGKHFPATSSLGRIFAEAGYDRAYGGKWHVPGMDHSPTSGDGPAPTGGPGSAPPWSGFESIHRGAHQGLAAACVDYLNADERRERPFLLVASFNEPHGICEWARGQSPPSGEVEDPDWRDLPVLPPNFAAGSEEPEALRLVQRYAWMVHPTIEWDEERWRRYRHAYYRLCERVDAEIATLLTGLEASGLAENTVVVFTADHGDMAGAHRWNQKKVLYQEAATVPFILVPPTGSVAPRGRVADDLVSVGLDLLPTLCDYSSIAPDPTWAGRSVRPTVEARHDRPAGRDQVVTETVWTFPGLMPPPVMSHLFARLLRTPRYAYMCHSWGRHREQLFDLERDPGQLTNLATSGAHQQVLDDHRRRLADHCVGLGDGFARYVPAPGVTPR